MRAHLVLLVLGVGACASQPQPRAPSMPALNTPSTDVRMLSESALFTDIVALAQLLQARGAEQSGAACQLRALDRGWRVSADFAPGVQQLPDARSFEGPLPTSPVLVLTRWGQIGSGTPFAALSHIALGPDDRVAVVWLADAGLHVRATHKAIGGDPVQLEQLPTAFARHFADGVDGILLSADPRQPLYEIARALWVLGQMHSHVGLAVALPENTKVARPETTRSLTRPCNEPSGQITTGTLADDVIREHLKPLIATTQQCYESTVAKRLGRGELMVELRIDADGRTRACTVSDTIGDDDLARCVLSGADQLRFTRPDPPGDVFVQVPLKLTPKRPATQRPVCNQQG